MEPNDRFEIDIVEGVTVEHEDGFGQGVAGIFNRAGRAQWRRLDAVADLDAERRAVAEDLLNPPRLVVGAQDYFVDLGHLLEALNLVVEKRPIENRHDRFGSG